MGDIRTEDTLQHGPNFLRVSFSLRFFHAPLFVASGAVP